MAIYKGREVQLTSAIPQGYMETQNVTITHKDNSTEIVGLNLLKFTKAEKDKIQKDAGSKFDNIQVIEDKDYKDLVDSQNPDKIDQSKKPSAN